MAQRLTSLVLLLILAGGVLAGTPVFSRGGDSMSAMDCCKRQRMDVSSAGAAQLCCAVNCSDAAPTAPAGSANLSASAYTISDSILAQIAALLKKSNPVRSAPSTVEPMAAAPIFRPRYIQHHSFLI